MTRADAEKALAERMCANWRALPGTKAIDEPRAQIAARIACDAIEQVWEKSGVGKSCDECDYAYMDGIPWSAVCPEPPDTRPWYKRMGESPDCFTVYPPETPEEETP